MYLVKLTEPNALCMCVCHPAAAVLLVASSMLPFSCFEFEQLC